MPQSPIDVVLKMQSSEGAQLDSVTVLSVDAVAKTCSVEYHGANVADVPYVGMTPAANEKHWCLRDGTTLLVLG